MIITATVTTGAIPTTVTIGSTAVLELVATRVIHTGGANPAVHGSIVENTTLEKGLGLLMANSASILTPVESTPHIAITTGVIWTKTRTGTTVVLLARNVAPIPVTLETVPMGVNTVSCNSFVE